jgi:hypothetical protein
MHIGHVHMPGTLTRENRSSALFRDTQAPTGMGWVGPHLHLAVDGRALHCLAYLAFERMAHETEIKRREFVRYHVANPRPLHLIRLSRARMTSFHSLDHSRTSTQLPALAPCPRPPPRDCERVIANTSVLSRTCVLLAAEMHH